MENPFGALKADPEQDVLAQSSLLRLIFETEPECVKVVSADGRLVTMNPEGLAMIDARSLEEVRGMMVLDLVAPEHREAFVAMHREVTTGRPRQLEFEIIGLQGRRRWLETLAVPLTNPDGTISHLGLTRDITERRQTEALVNGRFRVLEMIVSGVPLAESLGALLRIVEEQSEGLIGSILLLDPDGVHLTHGAAPNLPDEYCRAVDGLAIGPGVGSCGTAAYRRELVIVEDIATDPLWADFRDFALKQGLRACWSSPIFDKDRRVLGTYAMYYRHPARPTAKECHLLELATETAAIAISKHRQEQALHLAEAALRESEERLRLTLENAQHGLWDWDVTTGQVHQERWSEINGYEGVESPIFEVWEQSIHPEDKPRVMASLKQHLETGDSLFDVEYRTFKNNGELIWVNSRGRVHQRDADRRPLRMMGTIHDITERKQAEAALRKSEAMLSLVLDSIPQGVFWKDRQSVYLGANRVSRQAMGLTTLQSVVGFTDLDVPSFRREQAEFFVTKDREVMDSNQPQRGIVETMTQPDGSTIWLETNKIPMHDAAGHVNGILGTWENITERKQANEELQSSRERLSALSRQLIAAQETERRQVARELHDEIGQALTGIKLNLKAIQQPNAAHKHEHLVADTLTVVDQALQQVRNLALDLRPSILDDLGLVAALRWCLDRQAQRSGYDAQFLVEPSEISVPPEIAIACYRVAQECLTNIARHAKARHVQVTLQGSVDELLLIVQNDGAGFDVPAARERAAHGASLGLLGMQERVELVNGRLAIESTSTGTTIQARFPVKEPNR